MSYNSGLDEHVSRKDFPLISSGDAMLDELKDALKTDAKLRKTIEDEKYKDVLRLIECEERFTLKIFRNNLNLSSNHSQNDLSLSLDINRELF